MSEFERKQALKQRDKARSRDSERIVNRTHKWVRTQHGMKLIKNQIS